MPEDTVHRILVVGQTPPPHGGQAMMIARLLEGSYANARLVHVRMAFSRGMDEMGRLALRKLVHAASLVMRIAWARWRHGARILYYPPSGPDRFPVLRDIAILLCVRWMFERTIFHFHAAGISELYAKVPRSLKPFFRRALFGADLAIQLSGRNPPDAEVLQAKRLAIVPNGMEDELPADRPPRPAGSGCRLLYVGLVSESKGLRVLVAALGRLVREGEPVSLHVVGQFGSEAFRQRLLEDIASGGLEGRVVFTGVLTGEAKREQFLAADVLCFPTFFESESFGLVAVEGMLHGLPVVVSRWRGVQSLIEDGHEGRIVEPKDADSLADALRALVRDPELRARMGQRGRERYLRDYTLAAFHRRMDECFALLPPDPQLDVTPAGSRPAAR